MSVGHNETLKRYLAMIDSGELDRARHGAKDQTEWAARVGMTIGQFRGVQRRAEALGLTVPRWADGSAYDAQPVTNDALPAKSGHNQTDVAGYGCESDFTDEERTVEVKVSLPLDGDNGSDSFQGLLDEMLAETGGPTTAEESRAADEALGVLDAGTTVLDPIEPPLPAIGHGFHVRGTSTLVRADGSTAAQWIKTAANANAVDPVAVLRAAFGEAVPKSEPVTPPEFSDEDLLACIAFGDPHFGQLSWHKDAGENFDLDIAERNMVAAVSHLITIAPDAGQCLLVWIGDNTHSDGQSNTTTKGTRVDVDGRTIKMLAVTIRAFRRAIDLALGKFGRVHGIVERGNHDELLSAVIALALSQHYENDPRVFIDTSPEMYHWYRFGQNLIGTHHGDKAKPMDLLGVMANDRAKDWGETKHRRFYCGHIHHEVVKEVPGLTVEYLRTLAPADAWHRGQGYRAGRDLRLDVFHREYGMINRHIVGIEQVVRTAASNG